MESKQEESKSKKTVVILLVLLFASLLGNVFQMKYTAHVEEEGQVEISEIESQFEDINSLYDESMQMVESYKLENDTLAEDLKDKIEELEEVKQDIEKLKRTVKNKAKLAKQLKAKYAKVVALNSELENRIDELLVENKTLYEKNESLKKDLSSVSQEKDNLGKKVYTGSKLKAEYFTVSVYKKRSSGKFKETKLAKRANKIEVEFSLLDNAIAEKTEKTVYLKIVAPTGKVLGNPIMGSDEFEIEGVEEKEKFSVKKQFTYTGEKQEMTLSYLEEELRFEKGIYLVEIYVDNYLAGSYSYGLQ